MRPIKFIFAGATLIAFSSCASLTPAGEKVQVITDQKFVSTCQKVGKVSASSSSYGSGAGMVIGNSDSSVQLRNLAGEMGDTVLMIQDDEGIFGSDRVGVVYRCGVRSQ